MNARHRLLIALIGATVLFAGVAAAQGGGGDGSGLVELIRGLIEFLQSILDILTGGA